MIYKCFDVKILLQKYEPGTSFFPLHVGSASTSKCLYHIPKWLIVLLNQRSPQLTEDVVYSKAPHKRTSGLRTTSLKFGQLSTQNTRTTSG